MLRTVRALTNAADSGQRGDDHRFLALVFPGASRRHAWRGVHMVRVRLPMAGGRLFRLGVRCARVWCRRRHAHGVRSLRRLAGLAFLTRRGRRRRGCGLFTCPTSTSGGTPSTRSTSRITARWGCSTGDAAARGKFRSKRLGDVVERIQSLEPDHLLITGDLTTTALPTEFQAARGLGDGARRSGTCHRGPR